MSTLKNLDHNMSTTYLYNSFSVLISFYTYSTPSDIKIRCTSDPTSNIVKNILQDLEAIKTNIYQALYDSPISKFPSFFLYIPKNNIEPLTTYPHQVLISPVEGGVLV